MNCPVCGSESVVLGVVYNKKNKEFYRKRRCKNKKCWSHFFTVEFQAVVNERFKKDWNENK